MWIHYNPNPSHQEKSDCIIRAIAIVENLSWDEVFFKLIGQAYIDKDMPSINYVWHGLLTSMGYERHVVPNTCPYCYTVNDFCRDFPVGRYILAVENDHVVGVIDGNFYDQWNSGNRVVTYYWRKPAYE